MVVTRNAEVATFKIVTEIPDSAPLLSRSRGERVSASRRNLKKAVSTGVEMA